MPMVKVFFIYVRDEIPCKILSNQDLPSNVEAIFIELYLKNSKCLLVGGYNPHKDSISYFLSQKAPSRLSLNLGSCFCDL